MSLVPHCTLGWVCSIHKHLGTQAERAAAIQHLILSAHDNDKAQNNFQASSCVMNASILLVQYKSHDHTSHQGTSSKLQDSCGQVPDPRVRKYTSPTEMGEGSEYFHQ